MAIVETDIKLFASERMEDTEDGGGRITGNVIVSGQENNIFPDISRVNRVYGNISLRKIFPAVNSQNTDVYYGAHTIISEIPADPAVSVTLFSTGDWDDTRTQQREYVERYLAKGGRWLGYLFERQLTGQKAITVWQRESVPLPDIGGVWVLTQNEGLVTEYTQYVRITKYTGNLQTFYEDSAPFVVRVLTVELSDPLLYDFVGVVPSRSDLTAPANIRTTLAVDAAKYYGCRPLAQNAAMGAMRVQVDSIYNQLVPSAQSEVPAVDVSAGTQSAAVTPSASGSISFNTNQTFSASTGFYLGNGCLPGSLSITVSGGALVDDGGDVKIGTTTVGTLNYASGVIQFNTACPTYAGTKSVAFTPAAPITQIADTAAIAINAANRGYVYTMTLFPLPAKGSVFIDYMAQGKWYRLTDSGNGAIRGLDSSYGSGSISYTTGSIMLTCGALPDVGSEIIFSWSAPADTFNRSTLSIAAPKVEFTLAHAGITPSSYTVTWPTGNSLTDNGAGVLTGSGGSGTINYATGNVVIRPTLLPLGGTVFTSAYSYGDPLTHEFVAPLRELDGSLLLQLPDTDITPKSLEVTWNLLIEDYNVIDTTPAEMQFHVPIDPYKTIRDNGSGVLPISGGINGTINYSSGAINFIPDVTIHIPWASYSVVKAGYKVTSDDQPGDPVYRNTFRGFEYKPVGASFPYDETGRVTVRYRAADTPQTVSGETFTLAGLRIDLTDQYAESIVPGSPRFTLGDKVYGESSGILYHSLNTADGSSTQAGTLNYASGVATLTAWTPGTANTVYLHALLTRIQAQMVDEVTFRTPGAPLRPSSLYLQANKLDGALISATASSDGTIATAAMDGTVDYQTGVVRVRFGQWVTAAGNEAEIWYLAEAVRADGKIFKPAPIRPETLKFNCVVYSYLPLDASILGVDTVRLPIDGKVVVFKKADIVVVHNTQTITCTNPLSAGATVDCGRVRLARIEVQDSTGVIVPASGIYTVNLDTGIVTFANPLTLTGYTQPLKIRHSVEDMALVTDVEINGTLSLNKVLSHDYAKDSSYVSTALVMGDLFARWTNPFSQGSWTSGWSDELIGASIIPQYNYNLNPIVVSNRGAIQQRWALIFTSATAFRIIGETLGQIGTGDINTDTAPTNPNNGAPYFTLAASGWGLGWVTGNVLRFNTIAANYPLSVCRTVLQSTASVEADSFRLAVRGDIDR